MHGLQLVAFGLSRSLPVYVNTCLWLCDGCAVLNNCLCALVAAAAAVAADEIGVQIEEPFGILPLEDVCIDIQSEIDAMMERQDIVTGVFLGNSAIACLSRQLRMQALRKVVGHPDLYDGLS